MDTRDAESSGRRPLRAALLLGGTTALAVGLLALVHEATRQRIEEVARARETAAIAEVLGEIDYDNNLLADRIEVQDRDLLGSMDPVAVYRARRGARAVAVVITPVARDGYSGSIRLLVGIDAGARVTGVRVREHRETPGLGDAIELRRSDWILGFDERSLADPPAARWKVRKDGGDFDQFTGATVTPRAVVRAVANTLAFFEAHREELLAPSETPGAGVAE
jgi:electron transport complex protein RnfG